MEETIKACSNECGNKESIAQKELIYNIVEELRRATDEGLSHEYMYGLIVAIQIILDA